MNHGLPVSVEETKSTWTIGHAQKRVAILIRNHKFCSMPSALMMGCILMYNLR